VLRITFAQARQEVGYILGRGIFDAGNSGGS